MAKHQPRWSPAQRAKFLATMQEKRAARAGQLPNIRAAIIYLQQAQADVKARLRSGTLREQDYAHLLGALALHTLTGGKPK